MSSGEFELVESTFCWFSWSRWSNERLRLGEPIAFAGNFLFYIFLSRFFCVHLAIQQLTVPGCVCVGLTFVETVVLYCLGSTSSLLEKKEKCVNKNIINILINSQSES